jgi:hypothetical protein
VQVRWSGPVARELQLGVVPHGASRVKELGWSGTEPARWPSGTRDLAAPRAPFPVGRWRRRAGACAREELWRWRRWSDDVQGNGVQGGDV